MTFLEEAAACGIDLFMVDALSRGGHPTHMSLDEAVALVRKLRPKRMGTVWVWIGIVPYISFIYKDRRTSITVDECFLFCGFLLVCFDE